MTTIHFVYPDGHSQRAETKGGGSVMLLAVSQGIDEILAECGGNALCGTCHVYVDEQWIDRLPAMGDVEDALLDEVAAERRPTSRLTCQIQIKPEIDGLVLRLPARQVR